ncbi:MAG: hypothetical protein R8G66_02815 [Cytophagales bacterium]|nr:hypothetical protein [Cytophagales bacterium]
MKLTKFKVWGCKVGLILWLITYLTIDEIYAQIENIIVPHDVSESLTDVKSFQGVETLKDLLVELDVQHSNKGVNLYTTTIGENPIPEVRVAELSEHDPWFGSSSKRRAAIGAFVSKAKSDFLWLAAKDCDERQTNFYRTLAHSLSLVDLSLSTTVITFSDAVEVSSVVSMAQFVDNPSDIVNDSYEDIVQSLEADARLPDLSNVKIIIVAPGQNNDLILYSCRFWKKFLGSKNADVVVQASF